MSKQNQSGTSSTWNGKYFKTIVYLICAFIVFSALLFLYISKALLPDTEELENPKYEIASQIISSDNVVYGKIFKYNREWLNYNQINPVIVNALVATEDERFFNHTGIDSRGTARAIFYLGKNNL